MLLFDPTTTEGRILQAAVEEFAEHGLAGARVDRIAKSANINKAMIYYYFESKENLYRQIFGNVFRRMMPHLLGGPLVGEGLEENLAEFVRRYLMMLRSNPALPRMMVRDFAEGGNNIRAVISADHFELRSNPPPILRLLAGNRLDEESLRHARHTMVTLIGACIVSVIGRPIVQSIQGITDAEYEDFLDQRRAEIARLFVHGLLIDNN